MIPLLFFFSASLAGATPVPFTPLDQFKSQCQDHPGDAWLGIYRFDPGSLVDANGKPAPSDLVRRVAPVSDILVLGRSTDEYFAYLASPDGQYDGTGRRALSAYYRDSEPRRDAYLYGSAPSFTNLEMRYGFSPEGKFEFRITDHDTEKPLFSAPLTVRSCSKLRIRR